MVAALIWLAAALTAPLAERWLWRRWRGRLAAWEGEVAFWGRLAYGVLPLYGAWLTGAIAGRDAGLRGIDVRLWVTGLAACVVVLAAMAAAMRWATVRRIAREWIFPDRSWWSVVDEPRWAFYRAAAAALIPDLTLSQLLGLILGGGEWLVRRGRPGAGTSAEAWAELARLCLSAALFALTRNLWLVMATAAAARALVRRTWGDRPSVA